MIQLDLSILNQKGTPMFNSDLTANRPAPAVVGRIFIATDAPYGIFRDTGIAWEQVAGSGGGGGNTIYTANDTLTGNRVVSSGGFSLTFNPSTTFATTLTAPTGSGAFSAIGLNTLSYTAGFSSSNLGNVYAAIGGINLQTFAGNATFAQANLAAANVSINSVDFSVPNPQIGMTQSTGIRVMAAHQNQFQYQGTNNGQVTHVASLQNLGFYRPPGATGILTITNAYGFLINDLNDYGAGFAFTNRWGIYQSGVADTNYFGGNLLVGSTSNTGEKLQIYGTGKFTNTLSIIVNSTNGALVLQQDGIGSAAQFIKRPNITNSVAWSVFSDDKSGAGGRSFGIGIGRSGDPQWTNGDFIFSLYSGTGGWEQSAKIFNASGNWAIERGTATTDIVSALFQVNSTTKGFLKPRMTNAQALAITSPAAGLEIYNTDLNEPCFYNGSSWRKINNSPM